MPTRWEKGARQWAAWAEDWRWWAAGQRLERLTAADAAEKKLDLDIKILILRLQ